MSAHGELAGVGVEGTGSYGAGLARYLAACSIEVAEVIRPNRQARRQRGKSGTADAVAAALAALNGEAAGVPKSRDGAAEAGPGAEGGPGRRGQGPHPGRQPAA
jgi:transposase